MFWIGFAVGVSVAFLVMVVCLAVMMWRFPKDDRTMREEAREFQLELRDYWQTANYQISRQYEALNKILENMTADKQDGK